MKAIVQDRYGSPDVLQFNDIDKPEIKDDEVLVRVRAAAVNPLDWFTVIGGTGRLFFGVRKPRVRVRGVEFAGVVEAVGKDVTSIRAGAEVFGGARGTFAEYAIARDGELTGMPSNLSFEQAAGVPVAGITAMRAMRDVANVQPGQKVLINGAAGGVGTFAVQIAAALGAEVTGVCSTANVDLVKSIGARHVVDYTRQDFTQAGVQYDVILDNAGSHSLSETRRALAPGGMLIYNNGTHGFSPIIQLFVLKPFVKHKLRFFIAKLNRANQEALKGFIESGQVRPVVDEVYPLSQAAKAVAHVGTGHAHGKVVISV